MKNSEFSKDNQDCYLRKNRNASNVLSKKKKKKNRKKEINYCLKNLRAKKKKKITQVNPCGVHPSSRSTASQEAKVLKYVI